MKINLLMLIALSLFSPAVSANGLQTYIEYAKADGQSLLLDAFVPEGDGPFPIAIIVHGGGWSGGDKQKDITVLFKPLTDAKFTWFSINYRLAPKHRWPACLEDVQTAIRWVKANAARFKGDPQRIAIIGYSAGGQVACMAAVLAEDDTRVQAVVGFAPPVDLVLDTLRRGELSESLENLFGYLRLNDEVIQILWDTSPINHLKPGLPPFLLIHGTADRSVPYQQSLNFQKRLKAHAVPCDLVTIEDAPHRITDWDKFDTSYKQKMINWLEHTIGNKAQSRNDNLVEKGGCVSEPVTITVSQDGTGDFNTVQAAVDSVPKANTKPVVVSISPGVYKERIVVPLGKPFIRFLGEDVQKTILTYNMNARMLGDDGREIGTFRTPSTTIEADDFSAENITFENSAGPVGQALAITVMGDRAVFRNCRFLGWQDTLLDQSGRHYYENCYIAGHVDFIFGHATSFYESCHIHCLRKGYITAADTPEHQEYGFVFSNCKITGESPGVKTYLGRPWRDYSNVIFLNTEMSEVVRPEGWHNWRRPYREKTARYAEFNSTGPGANPKARVPWARQLTKEQADAITLEKVLSGKDGWNPKTGKVNYRLKVVPASPDDIESLEQSKKNIESDSMYLFTSFRGDGEDGLYLAYSLNALDWTDLGGPFLKPQVGTHKLMRDPSLLQGPDGVFHMVWTTGWRDDIGFGYVSSKDLISWSDQKFVEIMAHQPNAYNVWAPELYYDQRNKNFIICWATTIPGHYPEYLEARNTNNHRMYRTTTKDFKTFTDARKFFEPGFSVIDGFITKWNNRYVLVHKDNDRPFRNLRAAFSDNALGPYTEVTSPFTEKFTEEPSVLQIGDTLVIYFDLYRKNQYGAVMTRDFKTFIDITGFLSFPKGHRHGTVLKVSSSILEGLKKVKLNSM